MVRSSFGFRYSFGFRHSSFGFENRGSWRALFLFLKGCIGTMNRTDLPKDSGRTKIVSASLSALNLWEGSWRALLSLLSTHWDHAPRSRSAELLFGTILPGRTETLSRTGVRRSGSRRD